MGPRRELLLLGSCPPHPLNHRLTTTKTSTKTTTAAIPISARSKRRVTPSLSASGVRNARVLPSNLLVVLPNNLLVGRNNFTLVTPITHYWLPCSRGRPRPSLPRKTLR